MSMMRYKLLGRSGLRVSQLALGTMTFGEDWGWGASRDESKKQLDAYVAAGGNFIDTACNYTNGSSEKLVGELIADRRDRFVVATKYTLATRADDPNAAGNHKKNLRHSLEGSLQRLGTDYIDLLWLHAWDFQTPIDEILRALDDVVRAGKVLYIGISDTPAWIVSQANTMADLRGWTPFVALQVQYSLVQRAVERELLPMAKALGLAVTPWGVLGSGILSGKFASAEDRKPDTRLGGTPWGDTQLNAHNVEIGKLVVTIAKELDKTPSQVAIAWLLAQQARSEIIPILGARSASQLVDTLGAIDVTLSAEQLARLDAATAIDLGFPHDFLARLDKIILGEQGHRIDRRR